MTAGKNRIMIFGPRTDGTYVVEFKMADGGALAISVPISTFRRRPWGSRYWVNGIIRRGPSANRPAGAGDDAARAARR
jgi:hypothetical protein